MADRPTTRIRASNGQFSSSRKSGKRRCADCRATSSAQWRTGSDKRTLCNACGIRITREAKRMKEGPSNFGTRDNPSSDRGQRVAPANSTMGSSSTRSRATPSSSPQESVGSSSTTNQPPLTRRRSTRLGSLTSTNSSAETSRRQVQQATQRRTLSGGSERESASSNGSTGRSGRGRVGGSSSHSPTQSSAAPSVRVNDARTDQGVVLSRVSDVQPLPPFSSLLDAQQNRNRSRGRCSLANLLNPQ